VDNSGGMARALRGAAGRLGPTLHRARRKAFIAQLQASAALVESTIDVDVHPSVRLGWPIRFRIAPHTHNVVRVGANGWIDDRVEFRVSGGVVEIGDWVELRSGCRLMVSGHLTIEGPSVFSWDVGLHCDDRLLIKKWASVSEGATIVDSNHFHTDPDTWFIDNRDARPTTVGVNTWVAANAVITTGVTVGDNCLVAANAVVVDDVPDDHMAVGAPAVCSPRRLRR